MRVDFRGELEDEVALASALIEWRRECPDEVIAVSGVRYREIFTRMHVPIITGAAEPGNVAVYPFMNVYAGNPTIQFAQALGVRKIVDSSPRLIFHRDDADAVQRACGDWLAPERGAVIAVDPWSAYPPYRLPPRWWRSLVAALERAGYRVCEVGFADQPDIAGKARNACVCIGQSSFIDLFRPHALAKFLSYCSVLIAHWNGSVALASAVGTPTVLIAPGYPPPSAFGWPGVHQVTLLQHECIGCHTVRSRAAVDMMASPSSCRMPEGEWCLDEVCVEDVVHAVSLYRKR